MTYDNSQKEFIEKIRSKSSSLKYKPSYDEILAELSIISNLLGNNRETDLIFKLLKSEDFVYKFHQSIFSWCFELYSKGIKSEILSIVDLLKNKAIYSNETANSLVNISIFDTFITQKTVFILKENSLKRQIKQLLSKANHDSDTTDIFLVINDLKTQLDSITNFQLQNNTVKVNLLSATVYEKLLKIQSRENVKHNGIHTGFSDIDTLTDGFDNGDLVLIAARPSMGKTAFALSMAKQLAMNGTPTAFFSIEMVRDQIMNRLFSQLSKIDSLKFRRGNFNQDEKLKIKEVIEYCQTLPLWIDDSATLGINDIREKSKELVKKEGVKAIFIDYIGIMKTSKEQNREREMSVLSQGLKQLAKEINIPVIVLSQLSRNVENRGKDKVPILADLRDSGSLEQDADQVYFIHRPEYYKIPQFQDGMSTENLAEIICAKHRNGPTGSVKLAFQKEYTLFANLDIRYEEPPQSVYHQREQQKASNNANVNWNEPYINHNEVNNRNLGYDEEIF